MVAARRCTAIDGNPDFRAEAEEYADAVWGAARDPRTGLFHFGGARQAQLLDQAAIVQIYATLATDGG